ncbi:MAG: TetR/AcrR family transcriptional regulator [Propionibacteriales bacterium]|nr:TetR/AcrR family transcriptional regulator [Propionibacteriales bacterium]
MPTSDSSRRTQAERRADSEQRLIQASVELIVEQGLENTSLADIGRRAGASHALVNHRFGSKDDLAARIIEVATEYYARMAEDRVGRLRGLDAVLEIGDVYLDLVVGANPLGRVHVILWSEAIANSAGRRGSQMEWDRQFRDFLTGLIQRGIDDGRIRPDVAVSETALTIVGILRGIAMQLMLDEGISLAGAKDLVRSFVLAELRPSA